jgi:hypothetical protein
MSASVAPSGRRSISSTMAFLEPSRAGFAASPSVVSLAALACFGAAAAASDSNPLSMTWLSMSRIAQALRWRRMEKFILVFLVFFVVAFLIATPFIAHVWIEGKRNLQARREKVPCPC